MDGEIAEAVFGQGPPIEDEKSDQDEDYVMPEGETESDEASFESDEEVSVSHHFGSGGGGSSSSAAAAGGSSDLPAGHITHSFTKCDTHRCFAGTKRKRTEEDSSRPRDAPQDEDYADI